VARVYVGCAGWAIPKSLAPRFPGPGTHLERYARVLNATEIDSSFYREHRSETYARWAAAVPAEFRFSVKLPREITHVRKLAGAGPLVRRFLAGPRALGRKLGPLLVQLPPGLAFDARRAGAFFRALRAAHRGPVVCEPRHPSWFEPAAEALLRRHRVARVAADPARVPEAAEPGGDRRLVYYRWHGAPRIYYSSYPDDALDRLADAIRALSARTQAWVIFDNTAAGAAPGDALRLLERLGGAV
jgi:uncharacterized protein YecE (DUF72 family)